MGSGPTPPTRRGQPESGVGGGVIHAGINPRSERWPLPEKGFVGYLDSGAASGGVDVKGEQSFLAEVSD